MCDFLIERQRLNAKALKVMASYAKMKTSYTNYLLLKRSSICQMLLQITRNTMKSNCTIS